MESETGRMKRYQKNRAPWPKSVGKQDAQRQGQARRYPDQFVGEAVAGLENLGARDGKKTHASASPVICRYNGSRASASGAGP